MHRFPDLTRRRFFLGALASSTLLGARPESQEVITVAGARFRIEGSGHHRHYVHIHGNETTAREILARHLRPGGGTVFWIQSSERNVPVRGGWLDPNRMFSREGTRRNLQKLNPGWTVAEVASALEEVEAGRNRLLERLLPPPNGLLFAVHNNGNGYSIEDELEDADKVRLPEPERPHEFFLCTAPSDFDVLTSSPYNVALQTGLHGVDDGSLSRLCATRRIRYVNLECGLGEAARQSEMLAWADRSLA